MEWSGEESEADLEEDFELSFEGEELEGGESDEEQVGVEERASHSASAHAGTESNPSVRYRFVEESIVIESDSEPSERGDQQDERGEGDEEMFECDEECENVSEEEEGEISE